MVYRSRSAVQDIHLAPQCHTSSILRSNNTPAYQYSTWIQDIISNMEDSRKDASDKVDMTANEKYVGPIASCHISCTVRTLDHTTHRLRLV
jgi:hypothetical protein